MKQSLQKHKVRQVEKVRSLCLIAVLGLSLLALLLCLAFFLFPLLSAIISVFFSHAKGAEAGYFSFATSKIASIFLFTIFHSFFSALLAVILGLCLAFFCANRSFKGKKLLLSLSAIPFTMPPLIIALSYILFFGNNGLFFKMLKGVFHLNVSSFLYSIVGIILVQGMYNFPIAMQGITESWQKVPKHEIEVATLLGASPFFIFRSVTLPHILPAIFSSFLLVFLFCFFSFVIVLMFGGVGVSTIEVELYKYAVHSVNAKTLGTFFLIEFSFALLLVFFHTYFNKKCEIKGITVANIEVKRLAKKENILFILLLVIILFFLILPLISIFFFSFHSNKASFNSSFASSQRFFNFSFRTWERVFSSHRFWRSFFSSIYIGLCTTIVSISATIFYTFLRLFIIKNKWIDVLPFLPLATSSIMLGTGWHFIAPNVSYFVGTLMLISCQASLFYPFAVAKINIAIKSAVPENLIEVAILLSQSKVKAFFSVVLPLISSSFKTASAIIFAMSIADASLPLVLGIEGFSNLSLLLFDYASSYRFSESAVIGTTLLLSSGLIFFFSNRNKKRQGDDITNAM